MTSYVRFKFTCLEHASVHRLPNSVTSITSTVDTGARMTGLTYHSVLITCPHNAIGR